MLVWPNHPHRPLSYVDFLTLYTTADEKGQYGSCCFRSRPTWTFSLLAKDCVHCFIVMLLSFIIRMWTSGHHLAPCDINDIRVKCHEGMCLEGCCKRSSTDVDSLIVIDHLKYVTQHFSFAFKLYESSLLCYGCQKDLRKGHTCASGRLRQPPLSDVVRSVSRFQVDWGAKRHITFIF